MTTIVEHHHADVSGGWLRAATFGAMDGLVTNIALIAGVGGASTDRHLLVLTGMAGLVAGAISMGIGEWTSVRTQNEQIAAELDKELYELRVNPDGEADELVETWTARGLPPDLARQVAEVLKAHPEQALRVHAQEELGVVPDELASPWTAAASSFVCFAVGAVIPLLTLLLGYDDLWAALAVGGLGLFAAGAIVSRLTARPWWLGGLRQLLLGLLAAVLTYGVGAVIGVNVA
ncbi:membrane protein [Actinoplanes ianthinogenes]|uniref:Membrane protein n=2 Tax=Actinoplanes ianthinogenes TaxID=122358 RepID=A0ABN6CDM9_9ACTN|nr:VIT1/CCC1 transporter family protein [Actinoplanes ianthinogenes]BCJ42402.1 membrane protein [Actinoplanes ianthinogenes]GGQ94881.1 membrane protein [Actinoplanes ianthinogenes]